MIGPNVKRLLGVLVVVAIIALIFGTWVLTGGSFSGGSKTNNTDGNQKLDPPDVLVHIPPSNSVMGSYKQAAVVSNGGPCAKIGVDILKKNGNAVDAAIATLFCDGVTCMQNMGIGGGFFMTIYKKDEGKAYSLNARETAPENATENMYFGDSLASSIGARAAGVPGELKGYYEAYLRFGSKNVSWSDLVQPTIDLCKSGVPVNDHLAKNLIVHEQNIRLSDTLGSILLNEKGNIPKLNDTIKLPKLAATLEVIAREGADALYNGSLTANFVRDIQEAGGIITEEDMRNYRVRWEEPIVAKLQKSNMTIYSTPPPGSGALLAFMLQVLDGFILNFDIDDVNTVQRITETFKHAYGRRTEFGDQHFVSEVQQLLNELMSDVYIQNVRNRIHENWTTSNYSYYGAHYQLIEDHGTANIAVLGPNGDGVTATSTVNHVFGCKFVSRSTGIILNNEMDDFSAPNITNYFGVPPSPANFIKPGKRPMSSMTPAVIVNSNGDVRLLVGSAGGTKITTSTAFVTMMNLWFGKNIKEAIDEPRIHHQLMPMQFSYEYGVLKKVVDGISLFGHETVRQARGSGVSAIAVNSSVIQGNMDWPRDGATDGY